MVFFKMMDQKAYWVGFNHINGIGSVRLKSLVDFFSDLSVAWQAPAEALQAAGLPPKIIQNLQRFRKQVDLELLYQSILDKGIQIITLLDESYPRRLKEIEQPPPVLYMHGQLIDEDDWTVAVVGTRRMTAYGRQVTAELSNFLGHNGITLVSGLARGVDGLAHKTILDSGGRTIAVLGSGVDRIYPPENRQLAARIIENGAIISDYAPGTPPEGINFPPRNRIISGLSLATIVVEAGDTSGALITASFAAEQGREVFAIPGNIYSLQSKGTNRLIQQGAIPLLSMEDILETLNLEKIHVQRHVRKLIPADDMEKRLLTVLNFEPKHIDEISEELEIPVEKVSASLALMELKGMVQQLGGMNYIQVREGNPTYGESE
jgi:DNA processing protein